MKPCFRCHRAKPLTDFCRDSSTKDGYAASCKNCKNKSRRVKSPFMEYNGKKYELPKDFGKVRIHSASQKRRIESLNTDFSKMEEDFNMKWSKPSQKVPVVAKKTEESLIRKEPKITIEYEDELTEIMSSLIVKFGRHFCLSVGKTGKSKLKFHSPDLEFKGVSPRDVVDQALSH